MNRSARKQLRAQVEPPITVTVTLRDSITGFSRTFESKHTSAESAEFIWTDGNYRCDCNRSLYLWNWGKLGPPGGDPRLDKSDPERDVFRCDSGDNTIILERLEADGESLL